MDAYLIVSSRSEGLGRMTVESIFMGCMPVGRNSGGTREILNQTGGMKFNDEDGLAHCLAEIESMCESDYRVVIENAQTVAISKFSNEKSAAGIYKFYKNILSNFHTC